MLKVLQTQQVLEILHLMVHSRLLRLQAIKSFNIQQLILMVKLIQQVTLRVILLQELRIFQDSREMIYNLIFTSIEVK